MIIADRRKKDHRWVSIVRQGYSSYADAAIILTFSVQVAAVVFLIKKSYGLGGLDFGNLTMEVTWAAALLTFLPIQLTYLITPRALEPCSTEDGETVSLFWISVSWVLFFFTFVTRMVSYFANGQVGDGPDAVISVQEAQNISVLCFGRNFSLPIPEYVAAEFFAIGGSIVASLLTISMLANEIGERREYNWNLAFRKSKVFVKLQKSAIARGLIVLNVLLWATPQIWTIFRFRQLQTQLAQSMNRSYVDNNWSFGQIMALIVFLPVFVQMVCAYLQQQHPEAVSTGGGGGGALRRTVAPQKNA